MRTGRIRRRVRYIPQLELAECGAAALAMVLDYHGYALPLVEARTACGVSRDGSSAAQILRAARALGMSAAGFKVEPKQLARLALPAILHWEFNHFVVLEAVDRRGARLVDPARGRRRVSAQKLSESFTGVALAFEPTPALEQRPRASGSLARYLRVLISERRTLSYIAAAALLLEPLAVLFPTATQVAVDHVIKPHRTGWLLPIALVLATSTVVRHTLEWLRDRVLIGLQTALDLTLASDFVGHLMHLPLTFFEQRSAGDLMQRVEANRELREISATLAMGLLDALLLFGYAALMLAYDLRLGALALAVSAARMVLVQLLRARILQGSANFLALAGHETSALVDALAAPEMTRALAAETALFARYGRRMTDRLASELELKGAAANLSAGMVVFDGAAVALVLWLGGSQVLSGQMTLGVFAGFLTLQRLIDKPLGALFQCVERYLYAQGILTRVDDVLACAREPEGTRRLPTLRGELVFEQVSFRHSASTPWLFRDLSFRVAPGEQVALVGRSGQGKSTLLKLLLGVLQPTAGRILLDGVELGALDRQALAAQVGVVMQEPFLLDDSIEHNLRLRIPDATQGELEDAARIACIHDVIESLPHGYRTRLGHPGVGLSGGQRQRLAIARAVVRRPRLLLLDEATSSLDLSTEHAVHQNLSALRCTRLLVAHRLATVVDADRILVLEEGRIVQEGPYESLTRDAGPFRDLVEARSA